MHIEDKLVGDHNECLVESAVLGSSPGKGMLKKAPDSMPLPLAEWFMNTTSLELQTGLPLYLKRYLVGQVNPLTPSPTQALGTHPWAPPPHQKKGASSCF